MHGGNVIGHLRFNHLLPHDGDSDLMILNSTPNEI